MIQRVVIEIRHGLEIFECTPEPFLTRQAE